MNANDPDDSSDKSTDKSTGDSIYEDCTSKCIEESMISLNLNERPSGDLSESSATVVQASESTEQPQQPSSSPSSSMRNVCTIKVTYSIPSEPSDSLASNSNQNDSDLKHSDQNSNQKQTDPSSQNGAPSDIPPPPPMPSVFASNCIPPPPPPPPMPFGCNSSIPLPPPLPNSQSTNGIPLPPPPPPLPGINHAGCPPPPPPMPGTNHSGGPPPPPPMPGGPPPPPPMPGLSSNSPVPPPMPTNNSLQMINHLANKRIVYNPKCMMKTLYWSKVNVVNPAVTGKDQKSIWEFTEDLELKFDEFEKLFAQPKIQPKKVKSIEKEEKAKSNETADLLDRNRAHNLNILIKSLRIDTVELANAIYNFDSNTFNCEKLKKISEIVATSEEKDAIADHLKNNPHIPLGNAERFLYDLNQIHCFGDRINCFLFTLTFDEQIQSIEHSLNNFKVVCRFLMNSTSLRNLISIILTLGNYMNSNTTRGQSNAFDISILPKLKDTKSSVDNSCNLLYFVVKIYIDQNFNQEDILKKKDLTTKLPVPEPQDLERASTVSFTEIKRELDSINAQMNSIEERFKRVLDSCNAAENPEELHIEPFRSKMRSMLEHARKVHQEHEESLEECHQMFNDTMDFFVFKPKSSDVAEQQREFFMIWQNFCTNFKDQFRKVLTAKIKEVVDNAKQGANKLMNKNVRAIKDGECKTPSPNGLKANGLKARLMGKFKR